VSQADPPAGAGLSQIGIRLRAAGLEVRWTSFAAMTPQHLDISRVDSPH
jgi:hypothetical protein